MTQRVVKILQGMHLDGTPTGQWFGLITCGHVVKVSLAAQAGEPYINGPCPKCAKRAPCDATQKDGRWGFVHRRTL